MDVLLLRRRAMMAVKKSRLPAAYQEVQYLTSSGTQYIDSTYIPNSSCKIMGKISVIISGLSDIFGIAGVRDATTYENNISLYNATSRPRSDFGKTISSFIGNYSAGLVEFLLGKSTRLNGNSHTFPDSSVPFTCTSSALIFTVNNSGQPDNRMTRGTLYYFRILDETNALVRDLVPCYRKADNKPGMYDLVTKSFFTNAGTGEFTVGPDVN